MNQVIISSEDYEVNDSEYILEEGDVEFCNLKILSGLGEQERVISLLEEISSMLLEKGGKQKPNLLSLGVSHGGFMEIKLSKSYNVINGFIENDDDYQHLDHNRKKYGVGNIAVFNNLEVMREILEGGGNNVVLFSRNNLPQILFDTKIKVMVVCGSSSDVSNNDNYKVYELSNSNNIRIYVRKEDTVDIFEKHFKFELLDTSNHILHYDNLIHYALMVKNGGESLRQVLRHNLPYMDEYTILDTGSTDGTLEILKEELEDKKRGKIICEDFINFRDSRNRCLELCGKRCKYIMMLDDTYMVEGNLREFLEKVRGDQFGDSFSMYISSDDVEYGSNRIIKSYRDDLRYKYKLHEVITPKNNVNVIIPKKFAYILDYRSDYMESRTMNRKEYDIKILNEMAEEEGDVDSRVYYYLGQTYNLLARYEEAYENFLKRVNHVDVGFIQEKIDACFEAARILNFQLKHNKDWEEVEKLYKRAYEMDKSRPDSLYFIGIHYYLEKEYDKAYFFFKEGFKIGYPVHCQYSLKPTLSYYYLPKFLSEVCYYVKDYALGYEVCEYFLEMNNQRGEEAWWGSKNIGDVEQKKIRQLDAYTILCWKKIYGYMKLLKLGDDNTTVITTNKVEEVKSRLVFLVNGGFTTWRGSDILKKGLGGSETFIVEISQYIQKHYGKKYDEVIVFCNCGEGGEEEYNGVIYKDLRFYHHYLENHEVEMVIVSRYPEYLGYLYECPNVEKVILILHDLIPDGEIILRHTKLQKVILLSEYHKKVFDNMFGVILSDLTVSFGYGMDVSGMLSVISGTTSVSGKIKNRFLYSSMANRGLYYLLLMWRDIRKVLVDATLCICSEVYNNSWLNSVCQEEMENIRGMLEDMKGEEYGIIYKGWVSKAELYEEWGKSEVWFYPTTFLETFCLTAVEAAISKTLIVTMPIGSLTEVVGEERGVLLNHNVTREEGREMILGKLFEVMMDKGKKEKYVEQNYQYWMGNSGNSNDKLSKISWEERSHEFVRKFL